MYLQCMTTDVSIRESGAKVPSRTVFRSGTCRHEFLGVTLWVMMAGASACGSRCEGRGQAVQGEHPEVDRGLGSG